MSDRPLVHRRTALAGGVGAVAAALLAGGCDADDLRPPEAGEPTPSPTTEPGRPTADEVLVETVLTSLASAGAVLRAARRQPRLRARLAPLARAHRAHVEALEGEEPAPDDAPAAGGPVTLRDVRRSERRLHTSLVEAAGLAESGALARLLASMAASVSQHLVALAQP